jgi:uncharacterized membrane protein HdeD (DUF308 family)
MIDKHTINPPRRTAVIWCFITALSILGIFNTAIFGTDGFNGGFALSFFSIFLFIMGIIVAVVYFRRAAALDKMLNGENLLAHWTYSQNEWLAFADREHLEQVKTNRSLFLLVAAISIIVGVVFVIVVPDSLVSTAITIGGLIVIIGFTALLTTWQRSNQNTKRLGEVFLNRDGVYINRELHNWASLGARLEDASIDDKHLGQSIITFTYSAPTRMGRTSYNARVPVPLGREAEAKIVLDEIKRTHPCVVTAD